MWTEWYIRSLGKLVFTIPIMILETFHSGLIHHFLSVPARISLDKYFYIHFYIFSSVLSVIWFRASAANALPCFCRLERLNIVWSQQVNVICSTEQCSQKWHSRYWNPVESETRHCYNHHTEYIPTLIFHFNSR